MEDSKFASRKFLLVLVMTAVLVTLNAFGKVSSGDLTSQLLVLYGAYAGANVASKFIQR